MFNSLKKTAAAFLAAAGTLSCMTAALPASERCTVSAAYTFLKGDIDRDGELTSSDASLILRYFSIEMLSLDPRAYFDEEQALLADVDSDGKVNESDAISVLRYYAYTLVELPIQDWPVLVSQYNAPNPKGQSAVPEQAATIGNRKLTIGTTVSALNSSVGQPTESIEEAHKEYTLTYYIYAPATTNLLIAIADGDTVVGYYALGKSASASGKAEITLYNDSLGSSQAYAAKVLDENYSTAVLTRKDLDDFSNYSRLCWYLTNGMRVLYGLAPMKWDETAAECAREHSQEMARYNYFGHNNIAGLRPAQRLENAGIDWRECAENINGGYADVFSAADGWFNSSGHRNNLLGKYKNIGIGFGYYADSEFRVYGTQDFFNGWDD